MIVGSLRAPSDPQTCPVVLGGGGLYMLETALVGICFGYKMMGISTCPADPKRTS